MRDELLEAAAVLIVPATRRPSHRWSDGPLPLPLPRGGRTDGPARSTYFAPLAGQVLHESRTHLRVDRELSGGARLLAVESVEGSAGTTADPAQVVPDVALLHIELPKAGALSAIDVLHRLVRLTPDHELRSVLDELPLDLDPATRRAFAMTLLTFVDGPPLVPGPWPSTTAEAHDRWLWLAATATPLREYPPPPRTTAAELGRSVELSADWSALVLRDGAGFIGARPDEGDPADFFRSGVVLFRSVYADALLLGWWQHEGALRLADRLARIEDPVADSAAVEALQITVSRFRHRFWWEHVTRHGPARDLLRASRAQYGVSELLEQIDKELGVYRELAGRAATRRTNALLALFTLLAIPIAAVGVLRDAADAKGWLVAAAVFVAVPAIFALLIVTTQVGRTMVRDLRARPPRDGPASE